MTKQDSDISDMHFLPQPGDELQSANIVDVLKNLHKRILARIDEEFEMHKTHQLIQIWLMSEEQYEKLPENPTWHDYLAAGAVPQGWSWVERQGYQDGNDETRVSTETSGTAE